MPGDQRGRREGTLQICPLTHIHFTTPSTNSVTHNELINPPRMKLVETTHEEKIIYYERAIFIYVCPSSSARDSQKCKFLLLTTSLVNQMLYWQKQTFYVFIKGLIYFILCVCIQLSVCMCITTQVQVPVDDGRVGWIPSNQSYRQVGDI